MDEQSIKKLAASSAALGDLDTKLSAALSRVEAALRRLFGVRVTTAVDVHMQLAFGKLNGSWALLLVDDRYEPDAVRLADSPRDIRARMFTEGYVEALIRGAVEQIDVMIEQRNVALARANLAIAALDAALLSVDKDPAQ